MFAASKFQFAASHPEILKVTADLPLLNSVLPLELISKHLYNVKSTNKRR